MPHFHSPWRPSSALQPPLVFSTQSHALWIWSLQPPEPLLIVLCARQGFPPSIPCTQLKCLENSLHSFKSLLLHQLFYRPLLSSRPKVFFLLWSQHVSCPSLLPPSFPHFLLLSCLSFPLPPLPFILFLCLFPPSFLPSPSLSLSLPLSFPPFLPSLLPLFQPPNVTEHSPGPGTILGSGDIAADKTLVSYSSGEQVWGM